ncbi:MAG TPA: diacylglycerol kinase family protein, partial [Candidatus Limnocylindrales bacterium]
MTSALVIGRHRTGKHNGQTIRQVRRALRDAGWTVDGKLVMKKKELERAARRAVKHGTDVVVAVGGDGAVVRVASALAETEATLGIVPTGTGNLLASNLGVPHGAKEAVRTLVHGRVRQIDLGRLETDGKTCDFAVAAGIGFDAEVVDKTVPAQKLRWGKLAYFANVLGQAGTIQNVEHAITLDGSSETTEASQVFIANFGKMLPFVEPRRRIRPDDGYLDVIIVRASGPVTGL